MKHFINSVALTLLFLSSIFFEQALSLHLRHLHTHQVNGSNVLALCALNDKVISVQQGDSFFTSWQINDSGEMNLFHSPRRKRGSPLQEKDCLQISGLSAHNNILITWTRAYVKTWRVPNNGPITPLHILNLDKSEAIENISSISNNKLIFTKINLSKRNQSTKNQLSNEVWEIAEDGTIAHLSTIKNSQHGAMCAYDNLLFYEESQGLIKAARIKELGMTLINLALSQHAHNDFITALHANNGLLFSASADDSIKIWQISENGELTLLHTQEGAHNGTIYALCTHNDLLISSGADGTIKTWRIQTTE